MLEIECSRMEEPRNGCNFAESFTAAFGRASQLKDIDINAFLFHNFLACYCGATCTCPDTRCELQGCSFFSARRVSRRVGRRTSKLRMIPKQYPSYVASHSLLQARFMVETSKVCPSHIYKDIVDASTFYIQFSSSIIVCIKKSYWC